MASPFNSEGSFPSSHVKLSHLISVKLDEKNFKQWKQQIEGVIRGYKLQQFVTTPLVPPRLLSGTDPVTGGANPAFFDWEQQDALICTWLLSTISDSLLPKLVDCTYSWQVWTEVHRHFTTLLATKARQLRSELRYLTKGSRTITEFLVRVREISEALVSIGDPVPFRNLIEIVLDALPEEYDSIVAAINSREDMCSLDELESSLLAHESRLEKNRKSALTESATVNLTQSSPAPSQSTTDASGVDSSSEFPTGTSHITANAENQGYGTRGGRNWRGGGRSGRGGGRFGRVSCQICRKSGHDASVCYHRYSYPGTPSFNAPRAPFNPYAVPPRAPTYNAYGYAPPRASAPPRAPVPQAFIAGSDPHFSNQWWYPDSGASHHVTPDASNLSDASSLNGTEQVYMGNGQGLLINSVGSMTFPSQTQPNSSLILTKLLLVPHITKNLISVSKFAQDNRVFFEFHPQFCSVK